MHFADLDSYNQALAESKIFKIEVMHKDGKRSVSSAMPVESFTQALADIAGCDETQSAVLLWNRYQKALELIPYNDIHTVRFTFE